VTGTWESRCESRINPREAGSARQGLGQEAGSRELFELRHAPCLPGVLKIISQIASGRRGICTPGLREKLTFRPNWRDYTLDEKIWLREADRWGDFTRAKRLANLVGQKQLWMRHNLG
jgi:hypothetical protein